MRLSVDAILFDIDGTLIDSTNAVTRAWRIWASRYGVDLDEILRVCHGRRTEDTVAMFLPPDKRNDAAAALAELDLSEMPGIVALPGAEALLSELPAGRWAAVTSGSRALMRARLATAGLPLPDVLVAGEDVTAGKPDPEGYYKAARDLGYDITRCLVIEDAPPGIEAGNSSGACTVGVATSHDAKDLGHAEFVIPSLTTLVVKQTKTGLIVTF